MRGVVDSTSTPGTTYWVTRLEGWALTNPNSSAVTIHDVVVTGTPTGSFTSINNGSPNASTPRNIGASGSGTYRMFLTETGGRTNPINFLTILVTYTINGVPKSQTWTTASAPVPGTVQGFVTLTRQGPSTHYA